MVRNDSRPSNTKAFMRKQAHTKSVVVSACSSRYFLKARTVSWIKLKVDLYIQTIRTTILKCQTSFDSVKINANCTHMCIYICTQSISVSLVRTNVFTNLCIFTITSLLIIYYGLQTTWLFGLTDLLSPPQPSGNATHVS